jgi:hypothetical protein
VTSGGIERLEPPSRPGLARRRATVGCGPSDRRRARAIGEQLKRPAADISPVPVNAFGLTAGWKLSALARRTEARHLRGQRNTRQSRPKVVAIIEAQKWPRGVSSGAAKVSRPLWSVRFGFPTTSSFCHEDRGLQVTAGVFPRLGKRNPPEGARSGV